QCPTSRAATPDNPSPHGGGRRRYVHRRLHLHAFRGEPAISGFDWHFTPNHRSSPRFATRVGSGLDAVSPALHPAHGSLTRFRAYCRRLPPLARALFRLAFAAAPRLFPPLNLGGGGASPPPTAADTNSPDHSSKGTPSPGDGPSENGPPHHKGSDCLRVWGFRLSFIPLAGCFSPFPHGTRALSVARGTPALEGGPPCFPQDSSCPVVLRIKAQHAPHGVRLRDSHPLRWRLPAPSAPPWPACLDLALSSNPA